MGTAAKMRLLLAAAAFVGWIGYLAYLAGTTTRPIVLSRPQFLVSDFDVIAEIKDKDGKPDPAVQIQEVLWPDGQKLGPVVTVANLPQCEGWTGPGQYILPLSKPDTNNTSKVVSIPRSPGYRPSEKRPEVEPEPPWIYPQTPKTREQFDEIHQSKIKNQ